MADPKAHANLELKTDESATSFGGVLEQIYYNKIEVLGNYSITSIPMPNSHFERINIDIAGPFPSFNGYTNVFVCINPFTRWSEAFSMPDMSIA